jgi:Calcineurin-like phosphoesterase
MPQLPRSSEGLATVLRRDLTSLHERHGIKPDVIVVSGDLTEQAVPSEFDEVEGFLDELTTGLNLPRSRVVLVPGNHDVNWSAVDAYRDRCEARQQRALAPYCPKWDNYRKMFSQFYSPEADVRFPVDQPWTGVRASPGLPGTGVRTAVCRSALGSVCRARACSRCARLREAPSGPGRGLAAQAVGLPPPV